MSQPDPWAEWLAHTPLAKGGEGCREDRAVRLIEKAVCRVIGSSSGDDHLVEQLVKLFDAARAEVTRQHAKEVERLKAELQGWRSWVPFVFSEFCKASMTDAELRAAVCAAYDALEAERNAHD